jgi:beta-ribofuranosylaminobenzene 5'-phosphate synthase
MTNRTIRIRTPSRLHFGLLGWGSQRSREFGGVGLMIEAPGIEVLVEPATSWIIEGTLAPRVEQLVTQLRSAARAAENALPPVRIRVECAPAEHVGLGVGTQLSLAVARAVLLHAGVTDLSIENLAFLTGRGLRSGIGLHGFALGGLVVDGGRRTGTAIPPLLVRLPFPEDWSILVVQPRGRPGLHGPDERQVFAELPPITQEVTDSLCRLVLLEILPAVIEHDLEAFGAALSELQARVGASFASAQGGVFASPQASMIVNDLRRLGFVGVGQSSWGPTLYGFCSHSGDDMSTAVENLRKRLGLDESSVFWTKADNQGAELLIED